MNKTVTERLREIADNMPKLPWCALPLSVNLGCYDNEGCKKCHEATARKLADMIEAEQAELRERVDECNNTFIDLAALDLLCDKLDCGDANHRATAEQIRKAMNGAKQTKTEHDGVDVDALLKLADEINIKADKIIEMGNSVAAAHGKDVNCIVTYPSDTIKGWSDAIRNAIKRPEPEVLDADGVPIKVGDTVWYTDELPTKKFVGDRCTVKTVEVVRGRARIKVHNEDKGHHQFDLTGKFLTHRKPDTFKSVVEEMLADFDSHDTIELDGYFARLCKLMGGE